MRLAAGDRPGAIAAVAAVPPTSSHHVAAQIAAVRIQLAQPDGHGRAHARRPAAAGARLGQLTLDAGLRSS